MDGFTIIEAVRDNQKERMLYAFQNVSLVEKPELRFSDYHYTITDEIMAHANLEFLKIAHKFGCKWDKKTCKEAATYGKLDCLDYMISNGCEWDYRTPQAAAAHGHLECLRYCFQHANDPQLFFDELKVDGALWITMQSNSNPEIRFNTRQEEIDLDDCVWRRCIDLDLSRYPIFFDRVKEKKQEIEERKQICKKALENVCCKDIINYCILPYI